LLALLGALLNLLEHLVQPRLGLRGDPAALILIDHEVLHPGDDLVDIRLAEVSAVPDFCGSVIDRAEQVDPSLALPADADQFVELAPAISEAGTSSRSRKPSMMSFTCNTPMSRNRVQCAGRSGASLPKNSMNSVGFLLSVVTSNYTAALWNMGCLWFTVTPTLTSPRRYANV
jgi:hypothetical protein